MNESYISTLNAKLNNSIVYKLLREKCRESDNDSKVLALIQDVGEYSLAKLKTVIKNMPEYTLHDEEHVFHMLHIIGKILPENVIKQLSVPDLMMIVLSVFLHDIGMCPEENQIKAWKGQLNDSENRNYQDEINSFQRFRLTYTQQIDEIDSLQKGGFKSKAQLLEDYIVTEYIRSTHAKRSRELIANDWNGKIKYHDTDLTSELADICFSHNESYTYLLGIETLKLCETDIYLCVPFVAALLRLSDILDFDSKRTPSILFAHLAVKNSVSLEEWKKHQAINAWSISPNKLIFSAQCHHPAIEATIYRFCDMIDEEIRNCTLIISKLSSDYAEEAIGKYKISLPAYVDRRKIGAAKDIATGKPLYRYHDTKFSLSKKQIIDLLMGTKLYGKPDVALRELIQNSIDACLLRQKLCELWGDPYKPEIVVSFYSHNGQDYMRVKDNGIGMNQHIIDNYYTNIGSSYYKSREFYDLAAQIKSTFKPISKFGIGILSCFMVCDSMEVETRRAVDRYEFDDPVHISIEGYESLFMITDGSRKEPGTDTIMKLRKVHPWDKMNSDEFIKSVKALLPLPPFDIQITTDRKQEICSPDDFDELDLSLVQDYTWKHHNEVEKRNIKNIFFDLNWSEYSFRGSACVACIVKNKMPVNKVDLISKNVNIDGEIYQLSYDISYGTNCIQKNSSSIEVNDSGEINSSSSFTHISDSQSVLSIHGIEVPCSLFSEPWYLSRDIGPKALLKLPFPIAFRLDIGNNNDLNLNSARTEIIYDETWQKFEIEFFMVICNKIMEAVGKSFWDKFKNVISKRIENRQYLEIINKI